MTTTVLRPFFKQTAKAPERTAIVGRKGQSITYAELDRWSAALAQDYRRRGVAPGDRVLLAQPPGPALYAALVALWRLGAVVVFPEPATGLRGFIHSIEATNPKAIAGPVWVHTLGRLLARCSPGPIGLQVNWPELSNGTEILETVPPERHALISFTSGSTGKPKAIPRSHGLLLAQQSALGRLFTGGGDEPGIDFVWFPGVVLCSLALGRTAVLPDAKLSRPDAADPVRLSKQIREHDVSRLFVPPSVCTRLMGPEETPPVREMYVGGGPIFPTLIDTVRSKAPAAKLHLVYGSTEAEPIAHLEASQVSPDDAAAMREGEGLLAGEPVPEVQVEIVNDEIQVAGQHVVGSYLDLNHNADKKVVRGDRVYHRTGDAGRIDSGGRLWLLGRVSECAAGYFPFAVEAAALAWPGVRQAAFVVLDSAPVLVIAGDASFVSEWTHHAKALGDIQIKHVGRVPMDRRHRSKADVNTLRRRLK